MPWARSRNSSTAILASLNGAISRIGYVVDGLTDSPANELEDYDYLGLNTVVTRDRPNSTGTLHMSYIANNYQNDNLFGAQIALPPGGYTGHDDAGAQDPYDGLDRFGRVVDQGWNGSVEYFLSYDADGNELAQQVASTQIDYKWKSEIFHAQDAAANAYDQLNRLQYFYRRANVTDVNRIAEHTGFDPGNVQNAKDHVFYNERLLDRYVDYGVPATMGRGGNRLLGRVKQDECAPLFRDRNYRNH